MNRRGFMRAIFPAAATPFLAARVANARGNQITKIELDINSNSWWPGWADTTRVNMEYSNAHQHTNGRQLEFSMAQHSRRPGDNTGVRWADFTTHAAPTMGYYWANNDTNIAEHDNYPSCYLPWKGWVALFGWNDPSRTSGKLIRGQKIISIDGTPSAIFRNNDGSLIEITDLVDIVFPSGYASIDTGTEAYYLTNYNAGCWVNPSGNITGWWGGGYNNDSPNGVGSVFKLLDDNPNYPGSSDKPLRLRIFRPTGNQPSPLGMRHMVQIGDWLYWGGCGINFDDGNGDFTKTERFYRIKVPDLEQNPAVFTQERITDCTSITSHRYLVSQGKTGRRYSCLMADGRRRWLIYMNQNGVYRYKMPEDDGNDGVWEGPHKFGLGEWGWAETISEGKINSGGSNANWHGIIGTHRSDLGLTFFRYNLSKKWNRIRWS